MEVMKAYRFRLKPTPRQLREIRRVAGCVRYVYNRLLAEREADYKACDGDRGALEAHYRRWRYFEMCKRLTAWRRELPWLAACHITAIRSGAAALSRAYENFFAGMGNPRFKRKGRGSDGFRFHQMGGIRVEAGQVRIPKIGLVRFLKSREIEGEMRTLAVKQDGEHWYVSFHCEVSAPDPTPPAGEPIGVDAGAVNDYTLSTGEACSVATPTKMERKRQSYLARQASKKRGGSNRQKKATKRLHRFKRHLRNRVHDHLHKLTTHLAKTHGRVSVEALDVKSLTASARGAANAPGRNVAAKAGLNREILARCFGRFRVLLAYKCHWYGGEYREVDPAYTSQRCHACGHTRPENRPSRGRFCCVSCGHQANADVNAALNIRDAKPIEKKSGGARRAGAGRRPQ